MEEIKKDFDELANFEKLKRDAEENPDDEVLQEILEREELARDNYFDR